MYRFRTLIVMLKLCLPFLAYHTTFAQAPELYVRGISDDWTVQEKYRMVNDNGVYSLYIDELSSVYTFKICTEDYSLRQTLLNLMCQWPASMLMATISV